MNVLNTLKRAIAQLFVKPQQPTVEPQAEVPAPKQTRRYSFTSPIGAVRLTLEHFGKPIPGTIFNDSSKLKDGTRVNRIKVVGIEFTEEELQQATIFLTSNGVSVRSIKMNSNTENGGVRFILEKSN